MCSLVGDHVMSGLVAAFRQSYGVFSLDINLTLPGRGVSAIYGSSGSGKTTLLRCIAGLERAQAAYLSINGEIWQDDKAGFFVPVYLRPLGFVFQDASLFAHLDVQQNLDYGLRRVPVAARRVALDHAVALLGIGKLLKQRSDTLSGGERQRVAIARALATSPRILLMDEPLASLDLQRKAEILPYLEKLHAELDIPVLYVSHAPDEVSRLADHLVLLEAGRVLASGPTRELMTRMDLPLAYGDSAAAIIDATVLRLEPHYKLAVAQFGGGEITVINPMLQVGQKVRLRIQARDVSLTLQMQGDTSVLNIFAVTVTALSPDSPGQVMVGLAAGGSALLARISQKSADVLQLQTGNRVFAQVKGVAVLG